MDDLDDFFVTQQTRVTRRLEHTEARVARRLKQVKPDTRERYAGAPVTGMALERSDETASHSLGPRKSALDEDGGDR